ncbi:hypothetical protein [Halorientalis marina]|jgi:hypothetical protein|uniref:hypothetical protein n=1 Tax=Halorientalis marina TaxID=2931976 RepID=UPI001FF34DD4|nr:hypothetical protein [Halorientalis marina]
MTDPDPALRKQLPPSKLPDTSNFDLIKAGIACMRREETVREYIGYENTHQQRVAIIESLALRHDELKE